MSDSPPRYKRPPIIERLVSLRAKMSQETYDRGFDEWRSFVEKDFPVYEPPKRWLLNVQEKHGIPTEISPELEITPRFSEKSSAEGFGWSIRCPPGQLTMNMHSSHRENRTYTDLRSRFPSWLEKWIRHFQVSDFTDLTVQYVNLLDHTTLATFAKENSLEVGKALNIFFRIPGDNEELTPPLDCKVTIKLRGEHEGNLTIHAYDRHTGAKPSLTLNLTVNTSLNKDQSVESILNLMDWCHSRIVDRFELIFTKEAKKSFEPIIS